MATRHSALWCAPLGLLLLLIGVISSHIPEVHSRPSHFWCDSNNRMVLLSQLDKTVECDDVLPSPVPLCDALNLKAWENKTLQQKHAEVATAFRIFEDGVQRAIKNNTKQCQTQLLKELGHRSRNYLAIVNQLQIPKVTVTPLESAKQSCFSQTSLEKVVEGLKQLVMGKLSQFAMLMCGKKLIVKF